MSHLPPNLTPRKRNVATLAFKLLLPFLIFNTFLTPAYAKEDEIQIEYSSSVYDQKNKVFQFKQPRIKMKGSTVSGANAEYSEQTNIMSIKGNIIIYSPNIILTANSAVLDLGNSLYTLYDATFFDQKNVVYGKAEKIEKVSEDTYRLHQGEITNCDPKEKAWELSSSRIVYQIDNFAYSVNSVLYLHSLPIFYTPFISWPTKNERATGLLAPDFSHHSSSDETKTYGSRLEIPYFIAIDRDHDLTITTDLIERRGVGLDLDYQYAFVEGMSGQFKGWYLDESIQDRDLELENLGNLDRSKDDFDLQPTRYKYQFNHKQQIPLGGTLNLEMLQRSDNEIDKEYFASSANLEVQKKQAADISYSIPYGSVSVEYSSINTFTQTSVYDTTTDEETVANKHPSVSLSQQYSAIAGSPVSLSLGGSWTYYDRIYGYNSEATSSSVKIKSPFSLDFLNIIPKIQRTFYRYKPSYDYRSGEDTTADIENTLNEFGWKVDTKEIELNFEVFRYFTDENDQKTAKLSIIPRLIYEEIEDVEQITPTGFGIAGTTISKKSLTYQIDTIYKVKNVETNKVRKFFQLSLIQPFDLNSVNCADNADDTAVYCVDHHSGAPEVEIGEQKLPLRISVSLSPTDMLSGSLYFRYDHQENNLIESRISLGAKYLNGGIFSISYVDNTETYNDLDNNSHPAAKIYDISNAFPISDRLSFAMSGKWDQARSKSNFKYVDSSSIKRLDRTMTDLTASLSYKHPCYSFSTSYSEEIKANETEEYVNKTLAFTFSIPLVPYATSSSLKEVTFQDGYEFQ